MAAPRVSPPAGAPAGDPIRSSALAHQPEALEGFLRLYGTLWSHGVLDQPAKELARLRNARVTDCRFCRAVRFAGAREQGLTEETVDKIRDGWEASDLGPREKAILRFTDAFLAQPQPPAPELRRELLAHFTPEQIVELAAAVALFLGFSKIAVALGPPPELPTLVLPTPDWPQPGPAADPDPVARASGGSLATRTAQGRH
jgi:AhpD family alkylhydroperoxidase